MGNGRSSNFLYRCPVSAHRPTGASASDAHAVKVLHNSMLEITDPAVLRQARNHAMTSHTGPEVGENKSLREPTSDLAVDTAVATSPGSIPPDSVPTRADQFHPVTQSSQEREKALDIKKPRTEVDCDDAFYIDWDKICEDSFKFPRPDDCCWFRDSFWLEAAFEKDREEFTKARIELPHPPTCLVRSWLEDAAAHAELFPEGANYRESIRMGTLLSWLKHELKDFESLLEGVKHSTFSDRPLVRSVSEPDQAPELTKSAALPLVLERFEETLFDFSSLDYEPILHEVRETTKYFHELQQRLQVMTTPRNGEGTQAEMNEAGDEPPRESNDLVSGKRKSCTQAGRFVSSESWQTGPRKRNRLQLIPGTSVLQQETMYSHFACFWHKADREQCQIYHFKEERSLRQRHLRKHLDCGDIDESMYQTLLRVDTTLDLPANLDLQLRQETFWRRNYVTIFPQSSPNERILNPYWGQPLVTDDLNRVRLMEQQSQLSVPSHDLLFSEAPPSTCPSESLLPLVSDAAAHLPMAAPQICLDDGADVVPDIRQQPEPLTDWVWDFGQEGNGASLYDVSQEMGESHIRSADAVGGRELLSRLVTLLEDLRALISQVVPQHEFPTRAESVPDHDQQASVNYYDICATYNDPDVTTAAPSETWSTRPMIPEQVQEVNSSCSANLEFLSGHQSNIASRSGLTLPSLTTAATELRSPMLPAVGHEPFDVLSSGPFLPLAGDEKATGARIPLNLDFDFSSLPELTDSFLFYADESQNLNLEDFVEPQYMLD